MKFIKTFLCLCIVAGLLVFMTGCPKTVIEAEPKGKVYFNFFDTVSYIYSYVEETQEEFDGNCSEIATILEEYHHMLDINYEYSGINNLCTVNKNAGGEPVKVDKRLIDFLLYAKQMYEKTNGEMNIMMGSVLKPWHECRTAAATEPQNAAIPDMQNLILANNYTDINFLEIDKENSTVRITSQNAQIDVGAVGKGYATEIAAQHLIDKGISGYVLNIGGNIRAVGKKPNGEGWLTGVKDPQNHETSFALKIVLSDTSCVTSGSYERFYVVGNKRYHHVIDKDTLMPSEFFSSVTVVCKDSGLADTLSTALFCMSIEDAEALLENFKDVDVLWIDNEGNKYMTDGLKKIIAE